MTREEALAQRRAHYNAHKEERKDLRHAYYLANQEAIKKKSSATYERVKGTQEFKDYTRARQDRLSKDPEHKAKKHVYYEANKALWQAANAGKDWQVEYEKRKASGYYESTHYKALANKYHRARVSTPEGRQRWREACFRNNPQSSGLTRPEADSLAVLQGGVCYLCFKPPSGRGSQARLNVDHCHKTGFFRKMLCSKCNRALGHVNDDPALLRRMADYLEQHAMTPERLTMALLGG